jgi:hypothetical protein
MITWEKMNHGEGELVEENLEIGSRKRTSQSEKMASEEGLSHNEIEVNAERLDNWVRQMEVYCSVQQIKDEATQIKLASL